MDHEDPYLEEDLPGYVEDGERFDRPVPNRRVQKIVPARQDNFATRFSRANGPAYALIVAAVIGRPDLFLWASAITSHLFYIAWFRHDRRAARQ